MKLNFDAVREILLIIEELSNYDENLNLKPLTVYDISNKTEAFSLEEVFYTLQKLSDGGYITTLGHENLHFIDVERYYVMDITFKGHEYLNTVRDSKIWNEIKMKILVPSFSMVMQIAPKIIMAQISNYLK